MKTSEIEERRANERGFGPEDRSPDADRKEDSLPPPRPPVSAAQAAANRANARKSTGPRTAAGKRRTSANLAQQGSARLLGSAESKTLGQRPGAAEELYRKLIAPYEPVPALLAMHFHDLARLHLELEAWERIRDAELEERWRQNNIERRKRCYELQADLAGTAEEVFDKGLSRLPDSPAKARKQAECLDMIKEHIRSGDYDMAPILRALYGKDLNPTSDRAQTICIRCERLMKPESGAPLSEAQVEDLLGLLNQEQENALALFSLYVDKATMPPTACVARLRITKKDRTMSIHGERLRQSIDRKQRVITSLLRLSGLDLGGEPRDRRGKQPRDARTSNRATKSQKKNLKFAPQSQQTL